jgi:hypothetical protein
MSILYLRNNKRKTGWLFVDESEIDGPNGDCPRVYFVNVLRGRKLLNSAHESDYKKLAPLRESIPLSDIVRIRSMK